MSEAKLRLKGSKADRDKLVVSEETRVEKWKAKGTVWGGNDCSNMKKKERSLIKGANCK